MKKRMKAIVLSLAVLIVLTGAYILISSLLPEDSAQEQEDELLMTEKTAATLQKLHIQNAKSEFTVVRTSRKSENGDPIYTVEQASDFSYVDTDLTNLVLNISKLVASRVVDENPESLAQYGLEDKTAAARATASYDDGSSVTLYIGAKSPLGDTDEYYAREASDNAVYTITSGRAELFMKHYHSFRDKTLLPVVGDSYENLHSLRVQRRDGASLYLERYDTVELGELGLTTATFHMTEPMDAGVDNSIIQTRLLEPLYEITAQTIVADHPADLSEYGLDNPFIVEVGLNSGSKTRLLVGHAIPDTETDEGLVSVFLMLEGVDTVFAVQGPFDFLRIDAHDLLNTIIWSHNIKSVESIVFTAGEKTYKFTVRDDEDFEGNGSFFATYNGKNIDEESMRSVFMRMIQIYGEDRVDKDFTAPEKADYTMTMTYRNGKQHVLRLMRINSRHYAADVNGFMNYYINVSAIKRLLNGLDALDAGEKLVD